MFALQFIIKDELTFNKELDYDSIFNIIEDVLMNCDFKIIKKGINFLVFTRDTSLESIPMSNFELGSNTHDGMIEVVKESDSCFIRLKFKVFYWGELLSTLFFCYIGYSVSRNAFYVLILIGGLSILRTYLINRNCKRLLSDVIIELDDNNF